MKHFLAGLKEALAKATDYNQLMKDFPIKELLTSTDLETTRVALQNILLALKKLRTTKYPVKRAVSLISTISSDLCQHLIQVIPFIKFNAIQLYCCILDFAATSLDACSIW